MATLTQKIATIRSVFNVSTGPFANQVAAWFAAHPGIIVQSIAYKRPDSTYTADEQMLRVAYLEASGSAIGGIWESRLYQTVGSTTAEDDFNAAYEVGIAIPIIPVFLLDITDHERARTGPESLLVIGIRTDVGPLGEVGYDRAVYIANPLNDIPAGMVGNALLLDASGATVSASIPITNVGLVPWIQNQRNYVVYDELEGVYIGIPTCCGASVWAPPMETTTTAFPCPANFPEPNPTTTFTTSTTTSTTSTTSTSTTTTSTTSTSTTTSSTTSTSTTTTTSSTTSTTGFPPCTDCAVSGQPAFTPIVSGSCSGLFGTLSSTGGYTDAGTACLWLWGSPPDQQYSVLVVYDIIAGTWRVDWNGDETQGGSCLKSIFTTALSCDPVTHHVVGTVVIPVDAGSCMCDGSAFTVTITFGP